MDKDQVDQDLKSGMLYYGQVLAETAVKVGVPACAILMSFENSWDLLRSRTESHYFL